VQPRVTRSFPPEFGQTHVSFRAATELTSFSCLGKKVGFRTVTSIAFVSARNRAGVWRRAVDVIRHSTHTLALLLKSRFLAKGRCTAGDYSLWPAIGNRAVTPS
jgi:hypothetical protein